MWNVAAIITDPEWIRYNGGVRLHIASFDDKLLAELAADRIRSISPDHVIVVEPED